MSTYPEFGVEERPTQPYVGSTVSVTMTDFAPVTDAMVAVFAALAERGVEPEGPPFFRYLVIDMERELVVEAGVPVAEPVAVGGFDAHVLPAGRYVTTRFTGHPDALIGVTGDLLAWADAQGLEFAQHTAPEGHVWDCRLEIYHDGPDTQPDWDLWVTDLAFLLAD